MVMLTPPSNPEFAGQAAGQGYGERLQQLQDAQQADFISWVPGGTAVVDIGEGVRQPLPFQVNVDGAPKDVLLTLSVGSKADEHGRPRNLGYPYRNGTADAVNTAAKTFAVIRTPYSDESPQLLELTPKELAEGHCDFSSQPKEGEPQRTLRTIRAAQEGGLDLSVPISADKWAGTSDLSLSMRGNRFDIYQAGNPQGYALLARRV
jgi:hypothetical protein